MFWSGGSRSRATGGRWLRSRGSATLPFAAAALISLASFAQQAPTIQFATEPVRVLLAADVATVTVRSDGPIILDPGRTHREIPAGRYTLRASSPVPPATMYHLFAKTFPPDQVAARDAWIAERRAEGFDPQVATLGKRIAAEGRTLDTRVDWVSLARESTASAAEARRKQLVQRGYSPWIQQQFTAPGQGFVQVLGADGAAIVSLQAPLAIDGAAPIEVAEVQSNYWGGKPRTLSFDGRIDVRISDTAKLDVIETLPIEEYLRGVLPAEMSASWPEEALKAQAVAARSDVVAGLGGRNALEGFDFFANEQSRAYLGVTGHAPSTDAAVQATAGEILRQDGRVAPAVFSANCGGWTENNDTAWFGPPDAALRGVPDLARGSTRKHNPAKIEDWLQHKPVAFCAVDETYFRWQYVYSEPELRAIISKIVTVGRIEDIVLGERGVSGRLKSVTIRGSQKTETIQKELPIRRVFGGLPSAMFTVHKSTKGGVAQFQFVGGGRGHGVGMCQHGARGMALQGAGYREILKHYYSGVSLARCE